MDIVGHIYQNEHLTLSPYAFLTENTKGREYPISPDEYRGEFQRDRDRILHSKSFRRLMHKTQVFLSPEHDHYRTRLTHTLEVNQIANTIARALRLNEDLCEAIALGHDLGHTPFGHAGERVLRKCFDPNFAHYEQSIRVADKLEKLNLTYEVRDGILHHTLGGASTLEGQLILEADHIAFINHDIDDALRAGIIKLEDIPRELLDGLGDTHGKRIQTMVGSIIRTSFDKPYIKMDDETKVLSEKMQKFLFENVYFGSAAKTEESKAEMMLEQLFRYIEEHPELLPKEYYSRIEEDGVSRTVCDYISGMTDRYATFLFNKLFIPEPWKG